MHLARQYLAVILCLFLMGHQVLCATKPGLYNISDLKILKEQKNFAEFLEHAKDIRPSLRDQQWSEMLSEMATGFTSSKLKHKVFNKTTFDYVESLYFWPSLASNVTFFVNRDNYGLSYLTYCFKTNSTKKWREQCVRDLLVFWNNTTKNSSKPDLALKIAELIKAHNIPLNLWDFYKEVTSSKISFFHCNKPHIQKTLLREMGKIIDLQVDKNKRAKKLNEIAHEKCWLHLVPYLKELVYSFSKNERMYAYYLLSFKQELAPFEKDLFHTLFILNGPTIGPTYNNAWSTIQQLGENFKRRLVVIEYLKKFDPLPGEIFAHRDPKVKNVLIEFIAKNLPEYLDYFVKTCLDYLSGNKVYVNGNPTIECHALFKNHTALKFIPSILQTKYKLHTGL
ncbi:MAG: hypothetical protein ISR65_04530 [Bacteriovoracaceae bacterium]|nr:hypothetical protein [Bacteriovoracaceae bacterium]